MVSTPSDKVVSQWLSQLSHSLASGIQPNQAILVAETLHPEIINEFTQCFARGMNWKEALEECAFFLSPSELAILGAAESSGTLPNAMEEISQAREEASKIKFRIKFALAYPIFVLHFAVLIIPIQYLFEGQFANYFISLLMIYVPLWTLALGTYLITKLFPSITPRVFPLLPVVSGYTKVRDLSLMCRTLAACIQAGMSIKESWAISSQVSINPKIARLGQAVIEEIGRGQPVSVALMKDKWLPNSLKQMYRTGEESGNLDSTLNFAAKSFADQAKRKLFVAAMLYPNIALGAVLLFAAYKIVMFYKSYFDSILDMMA